MSLRILGITGPIGCGKSTVARMTGELGAIDVVDADTLVHELMQPGTDLTSEVGRRFGAEAIAADGSVNRAKLARMVFDREEALRDLEQLVHPAVRSRFEKIVESHRQAGHDGVITFEAIRLLGGPVERSADAIWIVTCDPEVQQQRLRELRGYDDAEITVRLKSSPDFLTGRPVTVIVNDGDMDELKCAVSRAWWETFPGREQG